MSGRRRGINTRRGGGEYTCTIHKIFTHVQMHAHTTQSIQPQQRSPLMTPIQKRGALDYELDLSMVGPQPPPTNETLEEYRVRTWRERSGSLSKRASSALTYENLVHIATISMDPEMMEYKAQVCVCVCVCVFARAHLCLCMCICT
jgi:hypothetical protein